MTPPNSTKNPAKATANIPIRAPAPVGRSASPGRRRGRSASGGGGPVGSIASSRRATGNRGGSGGGTSVVGPPLTETPVEAPTATAPGGGSVTPNNCEHCRHWYVRPRKAGE